MIDAIKVFLMGCLCGALLLTLTLKAIPAGVMYKYHSAMDLCEANLPRNQNCKITATPIDD